MTLTCVCVSQLIVSICVPGPHVWLIELVVSYTSNYRAACIGILGLDCKIHASYVTKLWYCWSTLPVLMHYRYKYQVYSFSSCRGLDDYGFRECPGIRLKISCIFCYYKMSYAVHGMLKQCPIFPKWVFLAITHWKMFIFCHLIWMNLS